MKDTTPHVKQGFDPFVIDIPMWSPLDEQERDPKLREALHDAVDNLPPAQRDVINALFWEGLSKRDVARRLKCSRATIKIHLEAAMDSLTESVFGGVS